MSKTEPKRVLVAEVAEALEVDVRTVHRMIRRGELRGQKVHGGLRAPFLIDERDVAALRAKRATHS